MDDSNDNQKANIAPGKKIFKKKVIKKVVNKPVNEPINKKVIKKVIKKPNADVEETLKSVNNIDKNIEENKKSLESVSEVSRDLSFRHDKPRPTIRQNERRLSNSNYERKETKTAEEDELEETVKNDNISVEVDSEILEKEENVGALIDLPVIEEPEDDSNPKEEKNDVSNVLNTENIASNIVNMTGMQNAIPVKQQEMQQPHQNVQPAQQQMVQPTNQQSVVYMRPQNQPVQIVYSQPMQQAPVYPTMPYNQQIIPQQVIQQQITVPSTRMHSTAPLPPQQMNKDQFQQQEVDENSLKNDLELINEKINKANQNSEPDGPQSLNDIIKKSANKTSQTILQVDERDLLYQFAFNNPDKMINGKINFAAIIFGPIYFFYRKMFLLGLISSIIYGALYVFFNYYFVIGAWILFGILFTIIYKIKAKSIVRRAIKKLPNADSYELGRYCSKRGSVSLSYVILGIIFEFAIACGYCYYIYGDDLITAFKESVENYTTEGINLKPIKVLLFGEDETELVLFEDNDLLVVDNNYIINNDLSIEIPKIFENNTSSLYLYSYNFMNGEEELGKCELNLVSISNYDTEEELIKALKQSNGEEVQEEKTTVEENTTEESNEIVNTEEIDEVNETSEDEDNSTDKKDEKLVWNEYSVTSENETKYYYVTKYNNRLILVKYEIQNNASEDCLANMDSIIESIKIK